MRPNELWTRPNHGAANITEPPGHKPLVVNVVVVGLFEEEEEGIGIASDVVRCRVRIWTPTHAPLGGTG